VLTTLKIAVFAPIPSASVMTVIAVKPGLFCSRRKLYLMSRSSVSISKGAGVRLGWGQTRVGSDSIRV
jgi:hypothetical protein